MLQVLFFVIVFIFRFCYCLEVDSSIIWASYSLWFVSFFLLGIYFGVVCTAHNAVESGASSTLVNTAAESNFFAQFGCSVIMLLALHLNYHAMLAHNYVYAYFALGVWVLCLFVAHLDENKTT